jgi:1,2-diacylglycerol 3-alpha-glucosyltransferase
MKSKKHILLLVPGFPRADDDTECIPALQALVQELNSHFHQELTLSVVAFQYPRQRGAYVWRGISCFSAGGKNKPFPGKVMTWIRVAAYVYKLHKEHSVDVVHSFWLQDCTWIARWVARFTGARHVAHVMGQDVLPTNKYLPFLDRQHMTIIANSAFSAGELEKNFRIKSDVIIPFGIHPGDFKRSLDTNNRPIDLLNVGSLIPLKNQELFITIFAELKKDFPALTGAIIGEGPLAEKLNWQIHHLGLDDCLVLEGKQPRGEVLARMASAKILLHTASFESAGYVFPEALYSGMKVVCFETGFLPPAAGAFACKNKDEMLQTLVQLLGSSQEYHRASVPLINDTASAVMDIYRQQKM